MPRRNTAAVDHPPTAVKAGASGADGGGVSRHFTFRLEQVLDHRARREDVVRQELAQAMAAVAAQQERAVAAQVQLDAGLAHLRELMATPTELMALRAAHADLAVLRARAAYEAATVDQLGEVADERRAELVKASQDTEALEGLKSRARERHRAEELRLDAVAMDELALRRAARARRGAAA